MSETKIRYSYGRKQKLKSSKVIDLLFKEGKSIQQYPLRFVWLKVNNEEKLQVSVAVSKRFFAKAVHRNKIKRYLREAWRLQKNRIEEQLDGKTASMAAMIVFTGKTLEDVSLIPIAMQKIISKLSVNIEQL